MCLDEVVYDTNEQCGNYTIAFKGVDFRNRTFRAQTAVQKNYVFVICKFSDK